MWGSLLDIFKPLTKIPSALGMRDPSKLARTPDFVPPVRGGMEGIAPRALASMNPMRQMPAMPDGAGFNALTSRASAAMPDLPMRDMNIGGGLTNMAKAAEAAKPALEQYPKYVDPIRQKRDEFVNDRLQGRARWKQMVIPALLGAASQGGSGDPARMLGGALGGFGMGAFAPKQALEGEYEMREGGADREELGREQTWEKAQEAFRTARERNEIARRRAENEFLIKKQEEERLAGQAKTKAEIDALEIKRRQSELDNPKPMTVAPGTAVFDPRTQKELYRAPERTEFPFASSPMGIYDRRSADLVRPAPLKAEREQEPPSGATQAAAAVDKMRRDAMQRWDAAKAMPDGDPEKAAAIADAKSALAQFNEAVKQMGDNYGDYYETGTGNQNWGYYKPRKNRGQRASSGGSSGSGGTMRREAASQRYKGINFNP